MYYVEMDWSLGAGVHTYIYITNGSEDDVSYTPQTVETATATSSTVSVDGTFLAGTNDEETFADKIESGRLSREYLNIAR